MASRAVANTASARYLNRPKKSNQRSMMQPSKQHLSKRAQTIPSISRFLLMENVVKHARRPWHRQMTGFAQPF